MSFYTNFDTVINEDRNFDYFFFSGHKIMKKNRPSILEPFHFPDLIFYSI